MQITNKEAKFISEQLGNITLGEIMEADMGDLFVKLLNASKNSCTEVYLYVPSTGLIDAIKTIRGMFGWGLKESKDCYDKLDPNRAYGRIGPIRTNETGSTLVTRYNAYADEFFGGRVNSVKYEIVEV
jgi:hypothetical protein